jgi:hypothetical protein
MCDVIPSQMGYQLNGDSFGLATFTKFVDYIALLVYACHFIATAGLLYVNVTRAYIAAFATPIGRYVNSTLFLSVCWQVILLIYQYTNAPPVIAWLFGFVAALIIGLSAIGQIEILKSFVLKQHFWTVQRLYYLQLAYAVWFFCCLWPAFLLLPTLGGTPPAVYYQAYSIGYVLWAFSNQVVIWTCSYKMGQQTKLLMVSCQQFGNNGQSDRIKKLSMAIMFLISIIVLSMILWIVSWFAPDPDNGVAMTIFLIACSLAGSSVVLVTAMFKLLKYHTKRSKRQKLELSSTQIGTAADEVKT